jgi:hypothetical protein
VPVENGHNGVLEPVMVRKATRLWPFGKGKTS